MNSIELSSFFEQLVNKRVNIKTKTSCIAGVLKKMYVSNEYDSILIIESENASWEIMGGNIESITEQK